MMGPLRLLILIALSTGFSTLGWAGPMGQFYNAESSRRELFPVFTAVEFDTLRMDNTSLAMAKNLVKSSITERVVVFERILSKEGLAGYIYHGHEMGKVQLMDFAVALDAKGKVHRVLLTAYRESVGGEVKSKRFMQQFQGKEIKSRLRLNDDIDGISGATLSSRAITLGVRKAVSFWKLKYGLDG